MCQTVAVLMFAWVHRVPIQDTFLIWAHSNWFHCKAFDLILVSGYLHREIIESYEIERYKQQLTQIIDGFSRLYTRVVRSLHQNEK